MEVSKEMKEEIRKSQLELKNAIRAHQALYARSVNDEKNEATKLKIKEAELVILALARSQKEVLDRLRREIEFYRTKVHRNNVTLDTDIAYVAQQLKEHFGHNRKRKKSISLLKNSVLNELKHKNNDNAKAERLSVGDLADQSKAKTETNNTLPVRTELSVVQSFVKTEKKQMPKPPSFPSRASPSQVEDKRANFANALNKVKNSICSNLEPLTPISQCTDKGKKTSQGNTEQDSSHSPSHVPSHSPSPSPPLLPPMPVPGEILDKSSFLRHVGLVTIQQKDDIERKRTERKKRPTTSTNKNEFVYSGFEKRKKYNQFSYLQQHTPPQTRAKERLRRQRRLQRLERSEENSPPQSMESSPPVSPSQSRVSETPAWIASLPSGLTVEPLYGKAPRKTCTVCKKDTSSSLHRCTNCDSYFHVGCTKENAKDEESGCCVCPSCDVEVPDSQPVTLTPVPSTSAKVSAMSEDDFFKVKEAERATLLERNTQLMRELQRLETRYSNIQDTINITSETKSDLLAKNNSLQQRLRKLVDVIHFFQDTASTPIKLSYSDSDSDHSKTSK